MTEYSGSRMCSAAGAVTGRICRPPYHNDGKDAKILLLDGGRMPDERSLSCTVGIVFLSDGESAYPAQKISELYRIPCIRIPLSAHSQAMLDGKTAVLDAAIQKLFVDPDIETISKYFSSSAQRTAPSPRILTLSCGEPTCAQMRDGLILRASALGGMGEEQVYEYLCELSDKYVGTRIVVEVSFEREHSFFAQVRGVYRAGVWGRFCLLCSGVLTPQRARRCVELLHQCFFELDASGREFNGFISKGIVVDTPLLLLGQPIHRMIDLFCVDYFSLARRFSGQDVESSEVNEYVRRFAKSCGDARVALLSERALGNDTLSFLLDGGAFCELYLSEIAAREICKEM